MGLFAFQMLDIPPGGLPVLLVRNIPLLFGMLVLILLGANAHAPPEVPLAILVFLFDLAVVAGAVWLVTKVAKMLRRVPPQDRTV
jgi:hypothetical protein